MTEAKTKKEVLVDLINDAVSKAVPEIVSASIKSAIEPMQAQQTAWMDKLNRGRSESPESDVTKKGLGAARIVRALAAGKGDPSRANRWAVKALDSVWRDDLGDAVVKALAAGDLDAGGFMIKPEFATGIIEFLYNKTVVRRAGPQILPMNAGTLTLPKQTGSATAYYVGENQTITKSQPAGGQIVMTSKKLAALVPISNDLLRFDAGEQADRFVRNDLVRRIAVREDLAFLRGDGTQNTPRGLRYWAAAGNITASAGTSSANIETDVKVAINSLESNNVDILDAVWFMAPRSKNHLINLRDTNGNLIYPSMRSSNPTLFDRPVYTTNSIPTNLGGTGSELYLVNMLDVIIGESGGLQIEVDSGASYTDGNSLVSAFEKDQTVVRAIELHDLAVTHEQSVAVINNITWGA
jgi:HK97 family phage major capsid protein